MAIGTTAAIVGGVSAIGGGLLASQSADKAADKQIEAADRATQIQQDAADLVRSDLQPFREAGEGALSQLSGLVTDPNQQKKFIENNPFFEALAGKAQQGIMQNAAARGKVGSGGTAEALQNSLVLLGSDLLNQRVAQTQNLAGLGQSAAAQQAQQTQASAGAIGEIALQRGNVAAQEVVQQGNILQSGLGGLGNLAGTALCDIRAKENIRKIGMFDNGLPVYSFNYIGDDTPQINVMAQDVELLYPDAVVEIDGMKHVIMEKVCH